MQKVYLGDAVYAETDKFGALVLTTENGIEATNRIVLEPEVLSSLLRELEQEDHRVSGGIAEFDSGPAKGPDGES